MTGVLRFLVVFPFLTLRNLKFTIVNSISSLIFDLEAIKPLHVTGAHDSLIPGHARSRGRRDGGEVGGRRDDAWGMHSRCRFGPGMIGRRRCGGNHRRWWRVQHQGLEIWWATSRWSWWERRAGQAVQAELDLRASRSSSIGPVQTVRHTRTKSHKLICPGHAPPVYVILIYICGFVCIRQGRARPHYTKYTDIDDNAVIAYVSAKSRTLADDSFACIP
jgi:hypothetical protein